MLVELMSEPAWERGGGEPRRTTINSWERGEGKEGKVARERRREDARGKLHVLLPVERGREGTVGSGGANER